MLRPGDTVGDRYLVIEQIASGGMGTLWRAHHLALDVDVALKALSVDEPSPDAVKRFKLEARAVARLRSANIVQVLDYGVHEGQPYLAMELLQGEDLSARIAREGTIPLEETVRIMTCVARALQVAHDAEIVHRDLKPANIFLEKGNEESLVKVLDFGVAKDLRAGADPLVTTGSGLVGSPAYMSPEQVWGDKVESRSDLWAMGVVAFEMLTGHCPFMDETLAKIFERIIRAPLPKPRDSNSALPASLDDFFARALARAPADRFASAKELGEALRRAVLDSGTSLPEASHKIKLAGGIGDEFAITQVVVPATNEIPTALSMDESPPRRLPWWLALVAVGVVTGGLLMASRSADSPPLSPPVRPGLAAAPPSAAPSAINAPVVLQAPHVSSPASATSIAQSGNAAPSFVPTATATATAAKATAPRAEPKPPAASASSAPVASTRLDPKFGIPVPQ